MWQLSSLRYGLCFALLGLAGCDHVQPLYQKSAYTAEMAGFLQSIRFKTPDTREGQLLLGNLRDAFAYSDNAPKGFTLTVTPSVVKIPSKIDQQGLVGRYSLAINSSYNLVRDADGKTITQGTARSISAYNVDVSDFATLTAERDATERALQELAEIIRLRMANRQYE